MWPRHIELLQASGVWQRIVDRLEALGYAGAAGECEAAYRELLAEERAQVMAAIRGDSGYQSLWERRA
jgi:bacterioferritin-associated ferredoxin